MEGQMILTTGDGIQRAETAVHIHPQTITLWLCNINACLAQHKGHAFIKTSIDTSIQL